MDDASTIVAGQLPDDEDDVEIVEEQQMHMNPTHVSSSSSISEHRSVSETAASSSGSRRSTTDASSVYSLPSALYQAPTNLIVAPALQPAPEPAAAPAPALNASNASSSLAQPSIDSDASAASLLQRLPEAKLRKKRAQVAEDDARAKYVGAIQQLPTMLPAGLLRGNGPEDTARYALLTSLQQRISAGTQPDNGGAAGAGAMPANLSAAAVPPAPPPSPAVAAGPVPAHGRQLVASAAFMALDNEASLRLPPGTDAAIAALRVAWNGAKAQAEEVLQLKQTLHLACTTRLASLASSIPSAESEANDRRDIHQMASDEFVQASQNGASEQQLERLVVARVDALARRNAAEQHLAQLRAQLSAGQLEAAELSQSVGHAQGRVDVWARELDALACADLLRLNLIDAACTHKEAQLELTQLEQEVLAAEARVAAARGAAR